MSGGPPGHSQFPAVFIVKLRGRKGVLEDVVTPSGGQAVTFETERDGSGRRGPRAIGEMGPCGNEQQGEGKRVYERQDTVRRQDARHRAPCPPPPRKYREVC